jgi:hypothetical protein
MNETRSPSLNANHLAIFAQLGISLELLAAAGVQSVNDGEARDYGFQASSDLCGIVFPYLDPRTRRRVTARLRRDRPDIDSNGKAQRKYLCPFGDSRHLYFPPGASELLADTSATVVFVEAEKSSLALTALAFRAGKKMLAIATGGCWGWRGKVGIESGPSGERHEVHGPLPDLDRLRWSDRTAIVLFDANATTNSKVRAARRSLADELEMRGASVRIAEVRQLDGVNGPDDLIAVSGDEATIAVLDSAQSFAVTAEREAEAAIAALEADKTQDPLPAVGDVAAVADPTRRALLAGKLIAMKIPGLTKSVVGRSVAANRKAAGQKLAEATARAERERLLRLIVEPAQLIGELENYYADRRLLPQDAAFVEALFAMNTYTFDVFDTTPYLLYDSATGGCGKTTTLERHEHICAGAYLGVDPTPAVLYRRVDRDHPTWLLDEAKILQIHGGNSQELLALFDAGYKRGAVVSRCEEHGDSIRDFQVFCPKVLARIGSFRGTLLDRGIPFHLEKARGLRQRRRSVLAKLAAPLKEKLEAYALQYRARLEGLYQAEPDDGYWPEISGREAEVWGPLISHARLAGPHIEKRAVEAALRYSGQKTDLAISEDWVLTRAQEALEVLRSLSADTFYPKEIVQPLSEKEDWGAYLADRKNDKAQVTAVGAFLRQFRITSRQHTDSGTAYRRLEVIAALERHIPERPSQMEKMDGASGVTNCDFRSTDTVSDTSAANTSNPQSPEITGLGSSADTLTPKPGDAAVIEEEL